MAQLDFFQDMPLQNNMSSNGALYNEIGRLIIWHNYIAGEVSFNKLHFVFNGRAAAATTKGVTFSFGLYSQNGSTLSLANSATMSSNFSSTDTWGFYSFGTSAAQNISRGDWFFAIMSSTSGGASSAGYGVLINQPNQTNNTAALGPGGPFFRGRFSVTTNGLPASMHTSSLQKEISANGVQGTFPYILISA